MGRSSIFYCRRKIRGRSGRFPGQGRRGVQAPDAMRNPASLNECAAPPLSPFSGAEALSPGGHRSAGHRVHWEPGPGHGGGAFVAVADDPERGLLESGRCCRAAGGLTIGWSGFRTGDPAAPRLDRRADQPDVVFDQHWRLAGRCVVCQIPADRAHGGPGRGHGVPTPSRPASSPSLCSRRSPRGAGRDQLDISAWDHCRGGAGGRDGQDSSDQVTRRPAARPRARSTSTWAPCSTPRHVRYRLRIEESATAGLPASGRICHVRSAGS